MHPNPLTVSLNPDVSLNEIGAAAHEDAKTIQSSFDELVDELKN